MEKKPFIQKNLLKRRCYAFVFDNSIVLVCTYAIQFLSKLFHISYSPYTFSILLILYCVIVTYITSGQTIGKMLFGLKVEGIAGSLTLVQVVIRYVLLIGLFYILPSLYYSIVHTQVVEVSILIAFVLTVLANSQHRGWHDMLAKTKVAVIQ